MKRKKYTGWAIRYAEPLFFSSKKNTWNEYLWYSILDYEDMFQPDKQYRLVFGSKLGARMAVQHFLDNGDFSLNEIVFVHLYQLVDA